MTVNTTSNKIIYLGNGATTSFTFPYPGVAVGDIEVFTTDPNSNVVQQSPTAFTVTLNPPQGSNPTGVGGTVTYPLSGSPLAIGWSITILRSLLDVQETSLLNQGTMYPPAIEQALDYLTMLVQQQDEFNSRAITVPVSDPIPPPLPAIAFRKNTGFIFDSNGNPAVGTLPSGGVISAAWQPIVSSSTVQAGIQQAGISFPNRAAVQATAISSSVSTITLMGWAAEGDMGVQSLYLRGGPTGLAAVQSADGQWWNLFFEGFVNLRELGAGQGHGHTADDVAAMAAAVALSFNNRGAVIYLPPGAYEFSTGSFTITQNGTRIIGAGVDQSIITFNPVSTATLFTFDAGVGVPNGVSFTEISNLGITGQGAAIKTAVNTKNTTFFKMSSVNITNFTDSSVGQCIGLLYQGRNFCILENCQIGADNPIFFGLNPYRAGVQFEDSDYFTARNNQLVVTDPVTCPAAANNSCYNFEVDTSGPNHTACNVTNFSDRDSDWAGGRYGFNFNNPGNVAGTALNKGFTFSGIRREQEQGAQPTMFVFAMSNNGLADGIVIDNCEAAQALANITGCRDVTVRNSRSAYGASGAIPVFTADATCSGIKFDGFVAIGSSTISMTGQTLVRGRYLTGTGGQLTFPSYAEWAQTSSPADQMVLIGPASANAHQAFLWRASIDMVAATVQGSSTVALLPFSTLIVKSAKITIYGNSSFAGIAIFVAGSPGSISKLSGLTNFAVDGSDLNVSVFYNSNSSVTVVNNFKSGGVYQPISFTVEVEATT